MKSPTVVILAEFTPSWIAAWSIANGLGLSAIRRWLENHPSFRVKRATRYAVRTDIRNGEIAWSLNNL